MAMVCPQCSGIFDQRLECPRCDARLVFHEGEAPPEVGGSATGWQYTVWGRLLIGLVLSQGIYHGVRHLTVAGVLATGGDPLELWSSPTGFLLLQLMQLVGLFVGGLLAGAGQRQAVICGLVLGAWNGVLVVLIQPAMSEQFSALTLYAVPLVQASLGALAGWMGGTIWRPVTPVSARTSRSVAPVRHEKLKLFVGPIYWTRVAMGSAVAVCGALWAGVLLERVVPRLSNYALASTSTLQTEIMTWEIVALAILTGGTLAGASTRNGLTQGLAMGIATSVILFGVRLGTPNPPSFLVLVVSMFGPVMLGTLGGGFGAQLLPPVVSHRPRAFGPN